MLVLLTAAPAQLLDDASGETVERIVARDSEYFPGEIVVKRGAPVVLELIAEDRDHGFNLPDFDVRVDVMVGRAARVRVTPSKAGRFQFHCDVYCGSGHDAMIGVLEAEE